MPCVLPVLRVCHIVLCQLTDYVLLALPGRSGRCIMPSMTLCGCPDAGGIESTAGLLTHQERLLRRKEAVMSVNPLATVAEPLVQWPELGVCRVPYQVFTDQALYDLEQPRIFRGDVWHWIGLEAETP